jgi:S1-C subfamily serine protease
MAEPTSAESKGRRRRLRELWARAAAGRTFILGALATLGALLLYNAVFPAPVPPSAREIRELAAEVLASATPEPPRAALVYEAIRPSLVLIQTEGPGTGDEPQEGLGSGVIVSDDGAILTSLHVVDGADRILVTFADGSRSPAQVVITQPEHDIAVLAPDQPPEPLIPATLGNPGAVRVGDDAYVVGHPLGLYGSMSAGVISGLNRSFKPSGSTQALDGLIQIDAAVNPGNSGGPLLNRNGHVIGIVAGLVNPTEEEVFIGLGFAVPINVAGGAAGLPPY